MNKCENCNSARHTPSGRVACAMLNNPEELAILTGIPACKLEDATTRNQAVLNFLPGNTIYSGWAFPHRQYGNTEGTGVGQGIMWNDCILLDKDDSCAHWSAIKN